jgi:hypothetical protein
MGDTTQPTMATLAAPGRSRPALGRPLPFGSLTARRGSCHRTDRCVLARRPSPITFRVIGQCPHGRDRPPRPLAAVPDSPNRWLVAAAPLVKAS